ncbi:MAG: protein O-GlcNAcase [bacterium]
MKDTKKKICTTLRWCGVVEGFFYGQWLHSARMRHLEFLGEVGFNAYIYAPKDDPFHREKWREHYPQRQMKKFVELVKQASRNDIAFCWAISPGLSIRYSDGKDYKSLLGRLLKMADIGITLFGVFFDDIPPQLSREDKKFATLADAQALTVNHLLHSLQSRLPEAEIIFCTTEYYGVSPTPYLKTIGEKMEKEIHIFWTGKQVVSPEITKEDAETMGKILKRKPVLWDNYPVNDYNRNRLHLAPLMGRDPDLPSALTGYFANPMNEPEASRIALATAADYLRSPHHYNPSQSWRKAIKLVAPQEARKHLLHFADLMRPGFFPNEPAPLVAQHIRRFTEADNMRAKNLAAKELLAEFRSLGLLPEILTSKLKSNRVFLSEIRPYLHKLALSSKAGEAVMKSIKAKNKEKTFYIKKAGRYLMSATELPQQIAGNVIEIFVKKVIKLN